MRTINIHEAKTHLSRLLEQAVQGEPFIIARTGKPLVKVMPLNTPEGRQVRRQWFMAGQRMTSTGLVAQYLARCGMFDRFNIRAVHA